MSVFTELVSKYQGKDCLSKDDFLYVLSRFQEVKPFLEYDSNQLFLDIYSSMAEEGPVTLEKATMILDYLSDKNLADTVESVQNYKNMVSEWQNTGQKKVSVVELKQALEAIDTGTLFVRDGLMARFNNSTNSEVSVNKLGKLLDDIDKQLKEIASSNKRGDVAQILEFGDIEPSQSCIVEPLSVLKQEDVLSSIADLRRAILNFFQAVEYSVQDKQILSLSGPLKQSLDRHLGRVKDELQTQVAVIRDAKDATTKVEGELEECRTKLDLLEEEKELLKQKYNWLQQDADQNKENMLFLAARVRETTAELATTKSSLLESQLQYRQLQKDHDQLRRSFKEFTDICKCGNQTSLEDQFQDLKPHGSEIDAVALQQRALKQELDDANSRIMHFQRQLEQKQVEIKAYTRTIEELQFKFRKSKIPNDSRIQQASQINNLKAEGVVGLSTYKMSSYYRESSIVEVVNPQNPAASTSISRLAVTVTPPKFASPQTETDSNSKIAGPDMAQIDRIRSQSSSRLNVKLQVLADPTKSKPKPKYSDRYIDVEEQLYGHDYCGFAELDKVKSLMEKDKLVSHGLDDNHRELKFKVLSTDVKIIRKDGTLFNYSLLLTCAHLYFISGSKHSEKDKISLSEISALQLYGEDSSILVIKCGRASDIVLQTNNRHRMAIVSFIQKVRSSQEDPITVQQIEAENQVLQNRTAASLLEFDNLKYPYCQWLHYSRYTGFIHLEETSWATKTLRKCFLIVNDAGLFFMETDTIRNKGEFIQKLIMFLPVLGTLNCVQGVSKDQQSPLLRITYEDTAEGCMKDRNLRAKSQWDMLEIVEAIAEARRHISKLKQTRLEEEIKTLQIQ